MKQATFTKMIIAFNICIMLSIAPSLHAQLPNAGDSAIGNAGSSANSQTSGTLRDTGVDAGASNANPAATTRAGTGSEQLAGDTGRQIIDEGHSLTGSENKNNNSGNWGWLGLLGLAGLLGLRKRRDSGSDSYKRDSNISTHH